jgi:hypothetical protein
MFLSKYNEVGDRIANAVDLDETMESCPAALSARAAHFQRIRILNADIFYKVIHQIVSLISKSTNIWLSLTMRFSGN